ncbi:hypothetical protein SLS56_010495 [Neofusicoccum ribis]|uniref:Cytochrome P450 n=1 Tax=Neofusicoccum ribis TaxID=45134 RepID=A0ABR3SF66_9PEZI
MHEKLMLARKDLFGAVERGFLSEAGTSAAIARANIPDKAAQLVTSATDHPGLVLWERSAKSDVIGPGVVEADLLGLLRDFGACIAVPLLYGQDFLERYPQCLKDIWTFDHHAFPLLAIGVPAWAPLKSLKHGLVARNRLLDQMTALYRRIDQTQTGQAVDFGADMSDVSQVALDRNTAFRKHAFSFRQRASTDLGLLIGQNANTQPTVFWFILFIYSTPGLVQQLRAEVAPHITTTDGPEGLSITRFDHDAIAKDCQLLKSSFLETLRLTDEPTSIRHVSRPLTVVDGMHEHSIRPGTWISVPHSVAHRDASVFPSPQDFIPERFIEKDSVTGKRAARYGRLKPWGAGFGICKGRTFAVKEVLAIGSAIIMLWDMAPADAQGWIIPKMLPGTGVARPATDVRVVLKRRSGK